MSYCTLMASKQSELILWIQWSLDLPTGVTKDFGLLVKHNDRLSHILCLKIIKKRKKEPTTTLINLRSQWQETIEKYRKISIHRNSRKLNNNIISITGKKLSNSVLISFILDYDYLEILKLVLNYYDNFKKILYCQCTKSFKYRNCGFIKL